MTIARARILQWGLVFSIMFCATGRVAKADCADLLIQFDAATASRSLPDAKAVEAKIAVNVDCGDRFKPPPRPILVQLPAIIGIVRKLSGPWR
jgi:hypothetical protein